LKLDKILKTGNEVRIKSESDTFITTIDEIIGEDDFAILAPYKQGQQIIINPDEVLSVSCVTDRGLYMFEARVTEVDNSSSVIVICIRASGEVRRVQRRQAFRVNENVTVNARRKSDDMSPDGKWVKTNTIDIAELGMLLRFDEDCKNGQEMEMTIRLNMFGINEVIPKVKGKVVRCISTRNKEYGFLLGVKFEDLPEKARDALIKLVVLSQRNKLSYKSTKNIKKIK
jgi:c-di-GMP-binding flagellar brake protein YcgR